jgi:hypothetical protein
MSAVARQVSGAPMPVLDVFRLRCQARADLVAACLMDFHDAVDGLHAVAVRYGLVTEVGQDGVQAIMAEAFANVPRPGELEDTVVEQTRALDGLLIEVLSERPKSIVAASTLAAAEYLVKQNDPATGMACQTLSSRAPSHQTALASKAMTAESDWTERVSASFDPRFESFPVGRSMRSFAEEFDIKFQDARQRVSSETGQKKQNGKVHSDAEAAAEFASSISLDDFQAYMPMHNYIFTASGELWPASSIDSRLPRQQLVGPDGTPLCDKDGKPKTIKASGWLDQHKPVEQMTWAPGLPKLIRNRLISEGGWIEWEGVTCFNLDRPPSIELGNPAKAGPWLAHVHKLYPDNAEHIINWFAHRKQQPSEKINHALVLGGKQGIGKDTLLEPVKRAVGPWNFTEVSPQQMLGRFNGFLKSVILRVSEARDLGDVDRFQFYDHMKAYTAAPPDVLRVDEKNLREYSVQNCVGVIITSNHKTDGIYLPADDRRHYVAWSDLAKEDFETDYWNKLYGWYRDGGDRHVAAYLASLDLASFDPKAPPPKTQTFWEIVDASRAPENAELADAIDALGSPNVITLEQLASRAFGSFGEWLRDRKNARSIPHRLESCGYVPVRNDGAKDGLWKVDGRRQVIYAKAELSPRDRIAAANGLIRRQ